ncbi:MAG: hypothetical protein WCY59_00060 [Anaerovoracaceae bacterium]
MRGETPTLADLLKDIWAARKSILSLAALFLFLTFVFILVSTPLYRGGMIVAPADGYALGDYASSVSEGEALHIPFWRPREADGISTDYHRFIFTARGPSVAAVLLKDSSVLAGIAEEEGVFSRRKDWTAEQLSAYLNRRIKVEHLGATPLRRISYHHPDPAFAAALLRKIHLVADQLIRRDRRRQSESRIAYLQATLQKTINPEHRRGIANLLMQQEHIQMLANLDEPYAAIVVEAPSSTPLPVWPAKTLLLTLMGLIGAGIGYTIHVLRHGR